LLPLYLTEADIAGLITAGEAVPVLEACFLRMAAGAVENVPRRRLALDEGGFAVMYAVDSELGYAGVKAYTVVAGQAVFAVLLFDTATGELAAVLEADTAGQRRTGAASGVAAKYLARRGAATLGVIGCGWQAESQVEAIRAALPTVERVVAYCRTPERLQAFCAKVGAEPAESHADAAAQDVVVTVTTSRDPVLRGEWLREGALVCAVGANDLRKRELDNVVLERASFVCCDSKEDAKLESGDLIEPVEAGVLDWLEVHELQEVVAGSVPGRGSDADVVVFKSNGLAAWDVAIGAELVRRARERGAGATIS
jgi:alanine dehydrogenase